MSQPTKQELVSRISKLHQTLKNRDDNWDYIFISDKINLYYFTGTMQNGTLVITHGGDFLYFVRGSFERAKLECPFTDRLYPMISYKDVLNKLEKNTRKLYLETEIMPYAAIERIGKYFDASPSTIAPVDRAVQKVRAVKSPYELACMAESGRQHRILLEEVVPQLLCEGIDEATFTAQLYEKMIGLGYHGVSRFGKFQTELIAGQFGFGENSLYPTNFDGPGGMRGMSPAVSFVGDRNRRLKKGDLVFVDVGYGYNGYHSDRTQVYLFGEDPPEEAVYYHNRCLQLQKNIAQQLKPGVIPSALYHSATADLDEQFLTGFMGAGSESVKFVGHGIGLQVDEYPVIAEKFDDPLEENMVLAVEPKRAIPGFGLVGPEDTYIVTPDGGKCITGGEKEIMVVK